MNATAQKVGSSADAWLSREPILSASEQVLGYELLWRQGSSDNNTDARDLATSVIDAINLLGLEPLCDGRTAFIKSTPTVLLGDQLLLLPPDRLVIEIPADMRAEPELVGACRKWKDLKYRFALDAIVANDPRKAFADFVDYMKLDVRRYAPNDISKIISEYPTGKYQFLATGVETRAHFVTASQCGFGLFQGYFFRTVERIRARKFSQNKVSQIQLLQATSSEKVDLNKIEELIKHDPSLSYRLLRYLNSPVLGASTPITSLRHGITMLGEDELTRWIRVATMVSLGQTKCSDLTLSALVRGRFCELLAAKLNDQGVDMFLFGLLTIMDSILEVPMGVILEGLPLDAQSKSDILSAKIGRDGPLTPIYRILLAREMGDWEEVSSLAKRLNISLPFVNRMYNSAMVWASACGASASG